MNRYDRYPGDYLRDTVDLTMTQDGAYTRLLDWYYANERPIADSAKFRIARAFSETEQLETQWVLDRFFRSVTHGSEIVWVNTRADSEIAKAAIKIETARLNGQRGGRPRKFGDTTGNAKTQRKPTEEPTEEPTGKAKQNPEGKLPSPSPSDLEKNPPKAPPARRTRTDGADNVPWAIDWRPVAEVTAALAGSQVPAWAVPAMLEKVVAHFAAMPQDVRTRKAWVQRAATWLIGDWIEGRRPQREGVDGKPAVVSPQKLEFCEKQFPGFAQHKKEMAARREQEWKAELAKKREAKLAAQGSKP